MIGDQHTPLRSPGRLGGFQRLKSGRRLAKWGTSAHLKLDCALIGSSSFLQLHFQFQLESKLQATIIQVTILLVTSSSLLTNLSANCHVTQPSP